MFDLIIFGEMAEDDSHQCYKVGLRGCTAITGIPRGKVGGLDAFSYKIDFEDKDSVEIEDTIYVSD